MRILDHDGQQGEGEGLESVLDDESPNVVCSFDVCLNDVRSH